MRQKRPESEAATVRTKDGGPWMTLRSFLKYFFLLFINSLQPGKKKNQSRVHLLRLTGLSFCNLYLFIASLPLAEVFFFFCAKAACQWAAFTRSRFLCFFPPLKHNRHQCTAAVLCLNKVPQTSEEKRSLSWPPRWHERVSVLSPHVGKEEGCNFVTRLTRKLRLAAFTRCIN